MNQIEERLRFVDIDGLTEDFAGTFNRETIERYVADSLEQLEKSAKVPQFIPLLVERFTRERLRSLARASGLEAKILTSAVFICVHNAGRSQMAAAFMRSLGDRYVEAHSAGSSPAESIHPNVAEAMREIGLSLEEEYPKPMTDEVIADADIIVTMGCGDACPVLPGKRYVDWQLDDPGGKSLNEVRAIRDDIRRHVRSLLSELGHEAAP